MKKLLILTIAIVLTGCTLDDEYLKKYMTLNAEEKEDHRKCLNELINYDSWSGSSSSRRDLCVDLIIENRGKGSCS